MSEQPKSLMDALEANFKSRRTEVDILGFKVYVTPLTLGEQATTNAKHPDDSAMRLAEILVIKCHDAEGKPVFTMDDKQKLKRIAAADQLGRILTAINGTTSEEAEKN